MLKRAALAVAALAVGSLTVLPAEADHSWGGYHWARTANPFSLVTGDNVSSAWDGYLATTATEWSKSTVLDLVLRPGATTARQCKAKTGTVQVCNASYGKNGWLGLATISITGGTHITAGTAKMNDSYFTMAKYNNADEKNHVMCQEVGHTFGLGHTSEDGTSQQTCMDYSTSPNSTKPNQHDFDELVAIYSHLDSTTTVGTSSASSASVGDDRASWGREVHRSADGRESVFVRDFGRGNLVVSHVTWAQDAQAAGRAHHGD